MRTRRNGGDNGYRTAEDFASDGRGYEPRNSYSDLYRFQRDETDYRGQGEQDHPEPRGARNNPGNSYRRGNMHDGQIREWTNHRSGWNDNGAGFRNNAPLYSDHFMEDRGYNPASRNPGNYNRYENDQLPGGSSFRNYDSDRRSALRYRHGYDQQSDIVEEDNARLMNRNNSYHEPNQPSYYTGSNGNTWSDGSRDRNSYPGGNEWNRYNNNTHWPQDEQRTNLRRSRQGFGSMRKERKEADAQRGR